MTFTVARATRFPETVVVAARYRGGAKIVADNGLAWVELFDPGFIHGEWMFQISGMAETPNAIAARNENAEIAARVGGLNVVGCITGSGAHHTVESAADEVTAFSLW